MSPENAQALAELMERRVQRLTQAEAMALVLAKIAETDGLETSEYNRKAQLELLRIHDIGGIRLRDANHFAECLVNRLTFVVKFRPSRLHDYVSPSTSLAEIGAAELAVVTKALRDLGHVMGAQGVATDPHFHNRSHT